MKKHLFLLLAALVLLMGGAGALYILFIEKSPWDGTWWGVQDAGVNWSGDTIRNLEMITFTKNDDGTITVQHRVQQGSREIEGSLSGTGTIDGGRLEVAPSTGRRPFAFTYQRMSKTIETPLTNADSSHVSLELLTEDNNEAMENIRSDIIGIAKKPENKIDTTLSSSKS